MQNPNAQVQNMGMGQPMQNQGYQQQQQAPVFLCPKCNDVLAYDAKRANLDDVQCDLCDKYTNKVVSCWPCDYDLCNKCAAKRMR